MPEQWSGGPTTLCFREGKMPVTLDKSRSLFPAHLYVPPPYFVNMFERRPRWTPVQALAMMGWGGERVLAPLEL